jgi:hypothetical protein
MNQDTIASTGLQRLHCFIGATPTVARCAREVVLFAPQLTALVLITVGCFFAQRGLQWAAGLQVNSTQQGKAS